MPRSTTIQAGWSICLSLFLSVFAPAQNVDTTDTLPDAAEVLREIIEHYGTIDSYRDRLEVHRQVRFSDLSEDSPYQNVDVRHAIPLAFDRSGLIELEAPDAALRADGKSVLYHLTQEGQYLEVELEEGKIPPVWREQLGQAFGLDHPVFAALLQGEAVLREDIRDGLRTVGEQESAHEGRSGMTYEFAYREPGTPVGAPEVRFSVWIDETTGLVGQANLDETEVVRAMVGRAHGQAGAATPSVEFAGSEYIFRNVETGLDFAPQDFAYEVPKDALDFGKVLMFQAAGLSPAMALAEQPAPDFEGTTLDGNTIKLSDLRGDVVLIETWATWCGPCRQSIPEVQELHEQYAGKGLTVLGLNADQPGKQRIVERFLQQLDISFTQVMDPLQHIQSKFLIDAYPTTILIDQEGIVQAVYPGYSAELQDELRMKIEGLLAAKSADAPSAQ